MASSVISHYRIIEKLGAGGMGEVFLAEDSRLERKVAIKLLPAKSIGDEQATRRLIREAKVAATLDHQNICAIYEVGMEEDTTFIVMQYVEGEPLSTRIDNSQVDLEEAINIAAQVAEALAEAHSRNIVHRDIKPGNVIITPRGQVKVLDFGLAKLVQPQQGDSKAETLSQLTEAGAIVGTVRYMSPEQAKGESVDARSDIFSLGALLYECVTGKPAFPGTNKMEVCGQVIHLDPPPPSQLNPNAPRELDGIVLKALAKRVDERYQSASEMLIDLTMAREGVHELSQARTRPMGLKGRALPTEALATLSGILRRRTAVSVGMVAGLLIALLAVWGAVRLWRVGPHQPSAEAKIWYERGTNYLRDGAYFQASKALERAVELDDEFALAHARLAEAYAEIDFTDKAAEELLSTTSLVPDRTSLPEADAMYLDAIMATVRRDFAKAIDYYGKIAERAPDSDKASAYVDLGRAYEKNENIDKAIASYLEATKLDSQSAAASLRLAVLYGRQQNLKDATVAFNNAEEVYQTLSNQEGVTEVRYQRGTLLTTMGKFGEARPQLEKARITANKYQQIRILSQLSSVSLSEGNTAQAQSYATEAIDLAQASDLKSLAASGLTDLGRAFLFGGKHGEAEKYLIQALDFAKTSKARRSEARALLLLGSLNERRGNPDQTIAYVDQALAFYRPGGYRKEISLALTLLGRANRQKGDYAAALQIYEQQLKVAEDLGDASQRGLAHSSIGTLLGLDLERYQEGLTHIETSCEINESLKANLYIGYDLMNRGRLLWQLGRYPEARRVLDLALSKAGSAGADYKELLAGVYLSNAQMALSERRFGQAIAKSQQVINWGGPQNNGGGLQNTEMIIEAKYTLGLAQALSAAPGPGMRLCEEAVDLAKERNNPRLSSALLALADVMLKTNSAKDAVTIALQAQAGFARAGQQDSEWHAWLLAARAGKLAGNEPALVKEYASRADSLLSDIRQKWGAEQYDLYALRPDIQTCRKQINELLAMNK